MAEGWCCLQSWQQIPVQHMAGPCTALACRSAPHPATGGGPPSLPHLLLRSCLPQKFGLDSADDLTFGLIMMMLLDFLYLFVASMILGMLFGLVTAYCLRAFHFHHVSQASGGRGACSCAPGCG